MRSANDSHVKGGEWLDDLEALWFIVLPNPVLWFKGKRKLLSGTSTHNLEK